jgi:hypothetical protein
MGQVCGVGAAIDRMFIELCRFAAESISRSIHGPGRVEEWRHAP